MIFYSVGKRVKNFVKVIINPSALKQRENGDYSQNSANRTDIHKYSNGKIKAELCYLNNELSGLSTFYFENGIIRAREHYKDGKLMSEEFCPKGKLLFKRVFSLDGTLTSETRL